MHFSVVRIVMYFKDFFRIMYYLSEKYVITPNFPLMDFNIPC